MILPNDLLNQTSLCLNYRILNAAHNVLMMFKQFSKKKNYFAFRTFKVCNGKIDLELFKILELFRI